MRVFISYSKADLAWAEWIAWELYEAGFDPYLQAWHFKSGSFIRQMNEAIETSDYMLAVASPDWQASDWAEAELEAMLHKDRQRIVPVRVQPCELTGILRPYIAHEFHILVEDQARQRLLDVLPEPPDRPRKRLPRKKRDRPAFPGIEIEDPGPITPRDPMPTVKARTSSAPSRLPGIGSTHTVTEVPSWAADSGRDDYGLWAALDVEGVVARFRWIKPGTFWMGSPKGEKGRDSDETRHQVTLTRGYWLGETPCTQELWQIVTGENPSRFQSPDRPVEQVSWEDCQRFLEALNRRVAGLGASLPTEAEWEYACRAGTETGTYAGDLEILGRNNAPVLDTIAWYTGNSGVDFELDNGVDSSAWKEKQYPHERAGTHPAGMKDPNAWGLYDMLGNVYEWCADWYGSYPDQPVTDPRGPEKGTPRVIRGGSWGDLARDVRAAYRDGYPPGDRGSHVGFRLARGHSEPSGGAQA